jgi:Ca-activated chloride channel family protein
MKQKFILLVKEKKMETQQKVKMWLTVLLIAAPFATAGAMGSVPTQATLDVAVSHPYLSADKTQTAYLRVALTGFGLVPERWNRSPVNVAIVIDKSGSMSGEKIEKAKDAAIMAVRRLSSNDIVSVVTYDSTVNVVVPATRVSDKHNIVRMIQRIRAGGTTALFGGVSKGAREVRKFIGPERVNRIILLSDGLANVGPSSPAELGSLGASLAKEGISVTTIGLGLHYNEDLMTMLAYKSDGNHYFAEHAAELAEIFDSEFGQVLSVVAQDIDIKIQCATAFDPSGSWAALAASQAGPQLSLSATFTPITRNLRCLKSRSRRVSIEKQEHSPRSTPHTPT